MTTPVPTPTAPPAVRNEKRIYPSSSAFMSGPLVKTTKHSSCLRFIAGQVLSGLTKAELHQDIAAEYAALGALDEFRYSARLKKEGQVFEREKPFQINYKSSTISGRMDFLLEDGTVIEKKSVTSQHVYKRVFEEGQPEIAWVAQVASYLAFLKLPQGKIVASYYELSEELDGYIVIAEREWTVKTLDTGCIMLGQDIYSHTLKDLARWYALAEQVLDNPTVDMQGVYQPPNKYQSACNYCPIKKECQSGTPLAEQKEELRTALLAKPQAKEFKISVATKRRQANKEKKKSTK